MLGVLVKEEYEEAQRKKETIGSRKRSSFLLRLVLRSESKGRHADRLSEAARLELFHELLHVQLDVTEDQQAVAWGGGVDSGDQLEAFWGDAHEGTLVGVWVPGRWEHLPARHVLAGDERWLEGDWRQLGELFEATFSDFVVGGGDTEGDGSESDLELHL